MAHDETSRIVPGAKTAVLFIHGICGTPNHFRNLLPLEDLVPPHWSVRNILLDGHGKGVKDFADSSMDCWRSRAQKEFQLLAENHEQVILVAHSMGTLFSIQLALEYPKKIPFLFLIAVPLRTLPRMFGIRNILRLAFQRLDKDDPIQAATETVCGIETTRKLWRYIPWIPRIWELLREMYRTGNMLGALTIPAIAYQSEKDELVANVSRRMLEKSGKLEVYNLLRSTHFYYHPEDVQTVQKAFQQAMKQYTSK